MLDRDHTLYNHLIEINQVVHDVMSKHEVEIGGIELKSYRSLFDPAGPQKHPLISICARTTASGTSSWRLAAETVYEKLKSKNLGSPFVEIISHQDSWNLTINAVLNDEIGKEVSASWAKVRVPILAALGQNLESKDAHWSTVCVFMCNGRDLPRARYPTIVINMRYPAKADWTAEMSTIKGILSEHGVTNLRVEFGYGGLR